jgi:hypothetical protein
MITTTAVTINGINLKYTVSDAGMMIRQLPTGILYSEAYDVPDAPYTYEETDLPVPETEQTDLDDAMTALGVLGYKEAQDG